MTSYVKSMSKRNDVDNKEKILPVGRLGGTMIAHGEDFEDSSNYGQCLIGKSKLRLPSFSPCLTASSPWTRKRESCSDPGDLHCKCDNDLARIPRKILSTNEGVSSRPQEA